MTTPTRAGDLDDTGARKRAGRVRGWWREYGQLLLGAWLIAVSLFVAQQARLYRHDQQRLRVEAVHARKQSQELCKRARIFGPPIAHAYAKYHILTPAQVQAYRSSIPVACP